MHILQATMEGIPLSGNGVGALQGWIQDPPWEGTPILRGRQHKILSNFPKNCMKLREFLGHRGWCAHQRLPWIRHLIVSSNSSTVRCVGGGGDYGVFCRPVYAATQNSQKYFSDAQVQITCILRYELTVNDLSLGRWYRSHCHNQV